jgi:hypothetical protein
MMYHYPTSNSNKPVIALLDSGTPIDFIHPRIVKQLKSHVSKSLRLVLPDKTVTAIPYRVTDQSFMGYGNLTFVVFDSSSDVILIPWIQHSEEKARSFTYIAARQRSRSIKRRNHRSLIIPEHVHLRTLAETVVQVTSPPSSTDQLTNIPPPIRRALVMEYQDLFTPIIY